MLHYVEYPRYKRVSVVEYPLEIPPSSARQKNLKFNTCIEINSEVVCWLIAIYLHFTAIT